VSVCSSRTEQPSLRVELAAASPGNRREQKQHVLQALRTFRRYIDPDKLETDSPVGALTVPGARTTPPERCGPPSPHQSSVNIRGRSLVEPRYNVKGCDQLNNGSGTLITCSVPVTTTF